MRKCVLLLLFLFAPSVFFCESHYEEGNDWIIGAAKFEIPQNANTALLRAASDIPSLMLEKISTDAKHVLSEKERNDRQLYNLQTERLSLFLQLSSKIKIRDSLILTRSSERKLKKQIEQEEKNIFEIEDNIRRNLSETALVKSRILKDTDDSSVLESIALYNSDTLSLVSIPSDVSAKSSELDKSSAQSDFLDKYATAIGLCGLITGEISSYGDFISVSAKLHVYPGGNVVGEVTEIGELSELQELADNLVYAMVPKIANTIPVNLHFKLLPEEIADKALVFVDSILLNPMTEDGIGSAPEIAQVSYGEHKIEVSCDGYFTKSVTYKFTESSEYSVSVPLAKMSDGTFRLKLNTPLAQTGTARKKSGISDELTDEEIEAELADASFLNGNDNGSKAFANGELLGYIDNGESDFPVRINGKPIIGHISTSDRNGSGEINAFNSYYYVAEKLAGKEDSNLAANVRKRATEEEINNRRKWSYRAYSAFMLAVPVAVLAYGKYVASKDGFSMHAESADTVGNWESMSNAAMGLAIISGGFFVFELMRYIESASTMLPQEAYEIE